MPTAPALGPMAVFTLPMLAGMFLGVWGLYNCVCVHVCKLGALQARDFVLELDAPHLQPQDLLPHHKGHGPPGQQAALRGSGHLPLLYVPSNLSFAELVLSEESLSGSLCLSPIRTTCLLTFIPKSSSPSPQYKELEKEA